MEKVKCLINAAVMLCYSDRRKCAFELIDLPGYLASHLRDSMETNGKYVITFAVSSCTVVFISLLAVSYLQNTLASWRVPYLHAGEA
jgi:hypothetical protein